MPALSNIEDDAGLGVVVEAEGSGAGEVDSGAIVVGLGGSKATSGPRHVQEPDGVRTLVPIADGKMDSIGAIRRSRGPTVQSEPLGRPARPPVQRPGASR